MHPASACLPQTSFPSAESGGGIGLSPGAFDHVTIDSSTISGNSAGNNPNSVGGGIFVTSVDPSTVTVARSLISGNSALSQYNPGGGGMAATGTAYVYLRSSTVTDNYATVDAGGVLSQAKPKFHPSSLGQESVCAVTLPDVV